MTAHPGTTLKPTPVHPLDGSGLWIKDERVQPTGSFKVRGAMRWLAMNPGSAPIVTASSGNHARALRWALTAAADKRSLTVIVSSDANPAKVDVLRREGCEVQVCGGDNQARDARALELAESIGASYCSSHDDLAVIQGQSGVVCEVLLSHPDIQRIYVPIGGGGLFAGSILAARQHPGVEIIGVEPSGAASMHRSLAAGHRVHLPRVDTMCDGLRAVAPGALCFDIARDHGARVILIHDGDVVATQRLLIDRIGPVEPSGAVAVAGALSLGDDAALCVVTGGAI